MEASRDISCLIEIMARLRDSKNGCPWDLKQNFSSIAPYTIEEAYEVADAIERDDMVDLKEELGDLLLQPVYHAQLAAEAGHFDFDDVVLGITQKLLRRHPHVFGDEQARKAESAKNVWERIKSEEAAEKAAQRKTAGLEAKAASLLDNVPGALPGLTRAEKLQTKAAKVGFDWPNLSPVMEKIEEEWQELRDEVVSKNRDDHAKVEEEFGDFLFSVVNLARHLGIDPEQALRQTNAKFVRRFQHIEVTLASDQRSMDSATLDEMEHIWQNAKGIVG